MQTLGIKLLKGHVIANPATVLVKHFRVFTRDWRAASQAEVGAGISR